MAHSSSTTELINDSTNGTDTSVRSKRIIEQVSSAIAVGTFAYNLISGSGGQVTDERKRCVTTVSAVPYDKQQKDLGCRGYGQFLACNSYSPGEGWSYKIQMCTRNYNGEWHRNTMKTWQPAGANNDFFRSEDTLHIKEGTLKWLWFEYNGKHCIKYLAVSCGHHVLDEWKSLNFVIGANQLESLYRTYLGNRLAWHTVRCGPEYAGVKIISLDDAAQISLTVPKAALMCKDKDINCIKRHIFLDSQWTNCYG